MAPDASDVEYFQGDDIYFAFNVFDNSGNAFNPTSATVTVTAPNGDSLITSAAATRADNLIYYLLAGASVDQVGKYKASFLVVLDGTTPARSRSMHMVRTVRTLP